MAILVVLADPYSNIPNILHESASFSPLAVNDMSLAAPLLSP